MGAGSSSRLVGAIRAVAIIVVDPANGEGERRVGDAGEGFGIFVELCNFRSLSARDTMAQRPSIGTELSAYILGSHRAAFHLQRRHRR